MSIFDHSRSTKDTDSDRVLAIIRDYRPDAELLTEYILLARTIQTDGHLREHQLSPPGQDPNITSTMLIKAHIQLCG